MATTTRSLTVTSAGTDAKPCPCGCAPCEGTCCRLDCLVQPRFFCGQLLTDQDLATLVGWARDKFGLSRYRHGWGVVCGLDVRCASDRKRPLGVSITPGYAMSCCGDDIIICEDATLDLSDACREEADPCADLRRQLRGTNTISPRRSRAAVAAAVTGMLEGYVRAQDGSPIENATVEATQKTTGLTRTTTTDMTGRFFFGNLSIGDYHVVAKAADGRVLGDAEVAVPVNETATVNITAGETSGDRQYRVVDIYLRYAEKPSVPTTAMGRSACKEVAECEYSRTQEAYTLSWEFGTIEGDPVDSMARRWHEGYEACLDALRQFNTQFPFTVTPTASDVRRWLINWMERHPLHHFCSLRDAICRASDADIVDQVKLVEWFFYFVQDCRNAYLNCPCVGCTSDTGVPLARVWLRSTDGRWGRDNCDIIQIDPYPPYRRPIAPDCWPAPLGNVNVGRAIWHRRQEACAMLADLGVRVSEEREFLLPNTLAELEDRLQCDLFVPCHEERVMFYYRSELFGDRVVGFCEETPNLPPDVTLAATCLRYDTATATFVPVSEARLFDLVQYQFTVQNNTGGPLTSVALNDTQTNFAIQNEQVTGATRTWPTQNRYVRDLQIVNEIVHNVVTLTAIATGNRPVNLTATHDLTVIGLNQLVEGDLRAETQPPSPAEAAQPEGATAAQPSKGEDDFTVIHGIGESRAAALHEAGINTYAELAAGSVGQLKQLLPGVSEGILNQWIEDAKKLARR